MNDPINIADLERLAAEAIQPGPRGYFEGGAGDERTLRRNVAAFADWELRPRVLVDVSRTTISATVLSTELTMPILVAPVAFQRLAHPDGEPAMARAAAAAGTVMCLSTLATAGPGEVAAAAPGGHRWMQIYVFRDRGVTRHLIEEATAAGFEAIALTVDAPYPGARERDLRTGFEIPAGLSTPAIEAAAGTRDLTVAEVFGLVDPALSWDDLEALCSDTDLPVLVKGLMAPEDAELAAEHGAAGVVVSNHGGRQLDSVPATIDVVGEVADAVGDRIEVLMDGGIRRGTDVAVALARGARAVLIGRPALWGLAWSGQAGAERALAILAEELRVALALLGCASPAEVRPAHARRRPEPGSSGSAPVAARIAAAACAGLALLVSSDSGADSD
jgi:isopentenyl diphosphate isomerase/L-lactate dehydrogenase-like FMN-dependent dehydrogenase